MTYAPTAEQTLCIDALVSGEPMIQVRACAGSGKEQPLDTLIQTPTGPRQFGSLNVGDEVFGADGKITTITGILAGHSGRRLPARTLEKMGWI